MAKTKTASTKSPFSFVIGDTMTKEDLRAVHEMQNYARCEAVQNLIFGQGEDATLSPHGPVYFPASGSAELYRFVVFIDPDLVTLNVRTVATLPAGATGSVIVTIGGGSCTNSHTAGATTTQNGTIAVSSTGIGWQLGTIDLQADSGDPSTGVFDRFRVRSAVIAASALPDPQ